MSGESILVVDDEPDIRRLVQEILSDESYHVETADCAASARAKLGATTPDLMLLDIWMPDTDGIELMREWAGQGGLPCPVVMMSGHGTIETAVEALRLGAYDFIEKPVSMAKLLVTVAHALQAERLRNENLQLRQKVGATADLLGDSAATADLRAVLERIAATDSWVMIHGEAGTGKAVAARYLHQHSGRRDHALVEVSLAATPVENMGVQLFGSEHGGTIVPGYFEQAAGGTLLLDEVGDLDLHTQAQLMSALEEGRFMRIGGHEAVPMDVRVITCTHQDLQQAVREGRFREDLYYRLNVIPIEMPALRDRPQDIAPLCHHFIDTLTRIDRLPAKSLSPQALDELRAHDWPGNIRELKNVIQRLLILCPTDEIGRDDVRRALGGEVDGDGALVTDFNQHLRDARDDFERAYLQHHLLRTHGNVTALAEIAGMERTHLYRKLKQLGLNPKDAKVK